MPFCKACGQEIGTATFCPKCGANQSSAVAPSAAPAANPTEGLQENVAGLLCYAPVIGWIVALVLLLIDKRKFVKFHAVQALGLYVGLIVLYIALGIFTGMLHVIHIFFLGLFLYPLLWLASFLLMIFLMYKAYLHESYKLPVIGNFADGIASK
ncbi:MAG: DUF4870 domain-containing protein [Candidatus Acidiferrales bacterium]